MYSTQCCVYGHNILSNEIKYGYPTYKTLIMMYLCLNHEC